MKNIRSMIGGARAANLESIAFLVLLVMVFLLPVFFLPALSAPFQFTKTLIAVVGTLGALVALIVVRLREGRIGVPTSLVVAGGWLVALAYTASALFASDNLVPSFIGQRFEVDTAVFVVVMALLLTIVPLIVRTKERVTQLFLAVWAAAIVLALYQVSRFFFGVDFLSFDIFTSSTSNLVGKWNDLGIFFGLVAIMTLMSIDLLPFGRGLKIALAVLLAATLLVLAVVNFTPVWVALGLVSLGLFIQGFLQTRFAKQQSASAPQNTEYGTEQSISEPVEVTQSPRPRVSGASLVVLIVSLIFVLQGGTFGNFLSGLFNVAQVEARPSWATTIDIAGEVYKQSPVFGSGPNSFAEEWALHKPSEVNVTVFWNVDFTAGIGLIPTSFVTTGGLGALAWLALFLAILYTGYRGLISRPAEDKTAYILSIISFVIAVYLWALSIVYVPNVVMYTLTFLFTGVFVGILRFSGAGVRERGINFADNPRLGFVTVLLLTVVLIGTVVGAYSVGKQYAAATSFQRSVVELNINGDIDAASSFLDAAVRLGASDAQYRFATQIGLVRLNQIVNDTVTPLQERQTAFQQVLGTTIRNGQLATEVNPHNYQNWLALGQVYQAVVPLQIQGSYDSARDAYTRAAELAPTNASLALSRAQLEVAQGNADTAREQLERTVELKPNYTDAIFLLSQLQIQAGQVFEATRSVESATLLDPNNEVLFFQLGLLRYNVNNDEGAIAALERAVGLNNQYSNARYFLGLAYFRQGRVNDAIEQFEVVQTFNSENTEVASILENLRAGNDPFGNLQDSQEITNLEGPPIEGE